MSNETFVPPSQQSAQGPVPKPGEPVNPTKGALAGFPQVAGEPLTKPKAAEAKAKPVAKPALKPVPKED